MDILGQAHMREKGTSFHLLQSLQPVLVEKGAYKIIYKNEYCLIVELCWS